MPAKIVLKNSKTISDPLGEPLIAPGASGSAGVARTALSAPKAAQKKVPADQLERMPKTAPVKRALEAEVSLEYLEHGTFPASNRARAVGKLAESLGIPELPELLAGKPVTSKGRDGATLMKCYVSDFSARRYVMRNLDSTSGYRIVPGESDPESSSIMLYLVKQPMSAAVRFFHEESNTKFVELKLQPEKSKLPPDRNLYLADDVVPRRFVNVRGGLLLEFRIVP